MSAQGLDDYKTLPWVIAQTVSSIAKQAMKPNLLSCTPRSSIAQDRLISKLTKYVYRAQSGWYDKYISLR